MQDDSHQSQPHQETDHHQPENTHSVPAEPTQSPHKEAHEDHTKEKPVEHPQAPAATTVEHKDEHKEKPKEAQSSPVKTENKEKHEKPAEQHAPAAHAEAKNTKADSHQEQKPAEKHEKPEHTEAEKNQPAAQKPKEEAHVEPKKVEHKEGENKEVSPKKPQEDVHASQSKPEDKKPEDKKPADQAHHEPAKESSPAKPKENHTETKAETQAHSPVKESQPDHSSPAKTKEVHPEVKTETQTHSPVKESQADHSSPAKPKEVHSEVKTETQTHSPAKEPQADHSSPEKAKETHVEAKTEDKAHEPEHKSAEQEAKDSHKPEEKTVTSHEVNQSTTAEQGHTVTEKSPEKTEGKDEKKPQKTGRASTQTKKSPEPRASDGNPAAKERILEVKKMKQAYEDQLKLLNKELNVLSKQERLDKQVLSADVLKKPLYRDPLTSQKNSAKLLRPIDRSALDKNKPSTVQNTDHETEGRADEGSERPRREIKKANRLKEEPLYLKMEKQFFDKIVCPELEERKKALKEKREFSKPIELKDLKEHAIKYKEVSKKEILTKQMARMERDAIEHEKAEKVINVYKSSMLKHVLEKDEEHKVRDDKQAQAKKQRKDRQLQYGKLVKEMYFPKVDEGLRQGLQEKIQAEKTEEAMRKARQAKEPKTDYSGKTWKSKMNQGNEVRSTGNIDASGEYNSGGKSRVEKFLTKPRVKKDIGLPEALPESELPDAVKKINESLKEKIEKTGSREGQSRENVHRESDAKSTEGAQTKVKVHVMRTSPKKKDKSVEKEEGDDHKETEKQKKPYTNYLDDVRKKRQEQEKNGAKVKYGHWEKHLKNKDMTYQEKVLNILDDVNRIEHQAKLKEEKLKQHEHGQGQGAEPMDLEGQVTDMYLESIKAKLALIQGLS